MKDCTFTYLDKDFKPALSYYNNLHLGEDMALKLYLDSMIDKNLDIKYKSGNFIDWSKSDSDEIVRNSNVKRDLITSARARGVEPNDNLLSSTTLSGKYAVNNSEEFLKTVAVNKKAFEILITSTQEERDKKYFPEYSVTREDINSPTFSFNVQNAKEAISEAELFYVNNPTKLEEDKKLIDLEWNLQREGGSYLDDFISNFVESRERKLKELGGDFDADKVIDDFLNKNSKLDKDQKSIIKKTLKHINQVLYKLTLGNDPKYKIIPQFYIESPKHKLRGIIDIAIIDTKENTIRIIDLKTIKKNSYKTIGNSYDNRMMQGDLDHLGLSKFNKWSLQTSFYNFLAQEVYNFRAATNFVLPIEVQYDFVNSSITNPRFNDVSFPIDGVKKLNNLNKEVKKIILNETNNVDLRSNPINFKSITKELTERDILTGNKEENKRIEAILEQTLNQSYYEDHIEHKKIRFNTNNIEERRKIIKEYVNRRQDITKTASNFRQYFNTLEWPDKKASKNQLINGSINLINASNITSEGYTLFNLNSFEGCEELDNGILLAVSDFDPNEVKLIVVNSNFPYKIEYSNKTQNGNTIFAKLAKDISLQTKYPSLQFLENTNVNHRVFQAFLALTTLKKSALPNMKISNITAGFINYQDDGPSNLTPIQYDVKDLVEHVKIYKDLVSKSALKSKLMPPDLEKVLEDPNLLNPSNYAFTRNNHIENFIYYISTIKSPFFDKGIIQEFEDNYIKLNNNRLDKINFYRFVIKKEKELIRKIKKSNSSSIKNLNSYQEYIMISKLILGINGFDTYIKTQDLLLDFRESIKNTSKVQIDVVQKFQTFFKVQESNMNRIMLEFKNEHNKKLRNLATALNKSLRDISLFDNMIDANAPEPFMFKKLTDNTLHPLEKDYIEFFQNKFLEVLTYSSKLSDKELLEIKNGTSKKYNLRRIPILKQSKTTEVSKKENVAKKVGTLLSAAAQQKKYQESIFALEEYLDDTDSFAPQTMHERKEKIENLNVENTTYETNLSTVLYRTIFRGYKEVYGDDLKMLMSAINVQITLATSKVNETKKLKDFLDNLVLGHVENEIRKESKNEPFYRGAEKINNIATLMALAASPKTVVLEGLTNTFASFSLLTSNVFENFFTNNPTKAFTISDWIAAATSFQYSYIKKNGKDMALIEAAGILDSDVERFLRTENNATTESNVFTSRWFYFLNNLPYQYFKSVAYLAQLRAEGVYDAYTLDENTNNLIYDVKKDKRFYNNSTDTDFKSIDAKKRYEAFILELGEEVNVFNSEGKPIKSHTIKEIMSLKDYYLTYFGGMDKDSRTEASMYVLGRMFLKFKAWFLPKVNTYYLESVKNSSSRGYWKKVIHPENPEDYIYIWEGDIMEGIIQSLIHLMKGIKEEGFSATWENMTPSQKRNLSKLISDMILISLLLVLMMGLFDDEDENNSTREWHNTPHGKLLKLVVMNSIYDLNVIGGVVNMLKSEPFYGISAVIRTTDKLIGALSALTTGDFSLAGKELASTTGLGRSIVGYY